MGQMQKKGKSIKFIPERVGMFDLETGCLKTSVTRYKYRYKYRHRLN